MWKLLAALAIWTGLVGQGAAPERYSEGQVWEYRTRPGDEDSLIRIQRIERYPGAPASDGSLVYHVTIVGVHIGPDRRVGVLPHAPVSRETLDASVTRLTGSRADFPAADEGIAIWRAEQGGVFTLSIAEIADAMERVLGDVQRADIARQD